MPLPVASGCHAVGAVGLWAVDHLWNSIRCSKKTRQRGRKVPVLILQSDALNRIPDFCVDHLAAEHGSMSTLLL